MLCLLLLVEQADCTGCVMLSLFVYDTANDARAVEAAELAVVALRVLADLLSGLDLVRSVA